MTLREIGSRVRTVVVITTAYCVARLRGATVTGAWVEIDGWVDGTTYRLCSFAPVPDDDENYDDYGYSADETWHYFAGLTDLLRSVIYHDHDGWRVVGAELLLHERE